MNIFTDSEYIQTCRRSLLTSKFKTPADFFIAPCIRRRALIKGALVRNSAQKREEKPPKFEAQRTWRQRRRATVIFKQNQPEEWSWKTNCTWNCRSLRACHTCQRTLEIRVRNDRKSFPSDRCACSRDFHPVKYTTCWSAHTYARTNDWLCSVSGFPLTTMGWTLRCAMTHAIHSKLIWSLQSYPR